MGLGSDGGLLLPEHIPDVRDRLPAWRELSYPELATEVMALFADDIAADELAALARQSYAGFRHDEVAPVRALGGLYLQELFHGPTLAFKDLALQFLGNLFSHILERHGSTLNILAATSGDTGSAAIHGVRGKPNIHIFVLHPHGRVSPLQERQMTTVPDANVHNIAIEGSFDDGQQIIKALFGDLPFKARYRLGAVNSVNWARVLAQIVYYVYATLLVQAHSGAKQVRFCVPTGNFGNIMAGYLARRMGLPIGELLLATNENDILRRFFATGIYERNAVRRTLSPSMDIQVASNFERYLYYALGEDPRAVRDAMERFRAEGRLDLREVSGAGADDPVFRSAAGDTGATLDCIRRTFLEQQYVLDPHSAVGVAVAQAHRSPMPTVCLATAHPAKFPEAVAQAIGPENVVHHDILERLADLPARCAVLPASEDAVRAHIREALDGGGSP